MSHGDVVFYCSERLDVQSTGFFVKNETGGKTKTACRCTPLVTKPILSYEAKLLSKGRLAGTDTRYTADGAWRVTHLFCRVPLTV